MSQYNREREKAYIESQIKKDLNLRKEIIELYKNSIRNIEDEMAKWLGKYATDEGISFAEAKKRADLTDVEALRDKAKHYVENKVFTEQANDEMRRYNLKMRLSRHELIKYEINLELVRLGSEEERLILEHLSNEWIEEVTRQSGILNLTSQAELRLRDNMSKTIDSSFQTATWSDRLWTNNELLRSRLETGLRRSMLQGQNPRQWARTLRDQLNLEMSPIKGKDNAVYRTERLAISETTRLQIEAQLQSYKARGIKKLEVITEHDACKTCLPHAYKIVDVDKAVRGVNIPDFHPFCRCTTSPVDDRSDIDAFFEKYGV